MFFKFAEITKILPLPNFALNGVLQNSWHRSLDKVLLPKESIRLKNKNVWFIHPENPKKLEENFVSYVENHISLVMLLVINMVKLTCKQISKYEQGQPMNLL